MNDKIILLESNENNYNILLVKQKSKIEIGNLIFKIENGILYLDFLTIYDKGKHYGYSMIDYLMDNYKFNFIIGDHI